MWKTPKEDWDANTGITYGLLNDIGANESALRDEAYLSIDGFEVNVLNWSSANAGTLTIKGGATYVHTNPFVLGTDPYPVRVTTTWTKTLAAFSNGTAGGAKAAGSAAYAHGAWWFLYLLYNSTTGAYDYALDDNVTGVNVMSIAGYDRYRAISCVQINEYSSGLFGVYPQRCEGDTFYITRDEDPTTNKSSIAISINGSSMTSGVVYRGSGSITNSVGAYLVPSVDGELLGRIGITRSGIAWVTVGAKSGISSVDDVFWASSSSEKGNVTSGRSNFTGFRGLEIKAYSDSITGYETVYVTIEVIGFIWQRGRKGIP